ncbi:MULTISPECIES: hypothetical protein [unclassified Mesorhizobium]|uniref:hypothetical protein n=1 Tax=unclassified Mesorhizobium TaxID=325217 RepID=UPI000BAF146E|nr:MULTISPECIES: hypothetical protein [unclassified Mesorhizobium]TGT61038.1 hypothetical protein EN813_018930 [Mesorhizobium sp. M00.F.Ca.ET.170.01.1.1]AZO08807.1 hypothetical protein EJ074_06555 [Mesorhizobium sp. M3A.F.Ca.ET.080.04.2.1]PBB84048.1 hypothetical protein CK216_25000 [Mesorhizobium sp. WSM3876]RWB65624.1 MAG: hypothetical protein EOQ49_31505 [Mesorhizobium sp.]RWB83727.1 MAG: hypothetical protein EOQ52_26380 [Mesorhizobium sp.]
MPVRRKRHVRNAASLYSDLMLAPAVVMMRLPMIALDAGSSAPNGVEAAGAISEKALACAEGLYAAQVTLFRSALRFWPEIFSGRSPSLLNGAAGKAALVAAVRPASRRVRANFHRLTKLD